MRMFGETFVNEENKQFFEAFSWAIPHVCETEFVIDLDQTYNSLHGYEWAGFSSKKAAKPVIMKHLQENAEFTINRTDDVMDRREVILLTFDGFEALTSRAQTDRGSMSNRHIRSMRRALERYTRDAMQKQLASSAAQLEHLSCTMDTLRFEMALTHTPSQHTVSEGAKSRTQAHPRVPVRPRDPLASFCHLSLQAGVSLALPHAPPRAHTRVSVRPSRSLCPPAPPQSLGTLTRSGRLLKAGGHTEA